MGVFDAFVASGGAELSLDQLDEKTIGDKDLLGKMLFLLSSTIHSTIFNILLPMY